jgi:general secretion pathway protein G
MSWHVQLNNSIIFMKLQIDSKCESKPTPRKTNWVAVALGIFTLVIVYYMLIPIGGSSHEGRTTAAKTQISVIGTALGAYKTDTGKYPSTVDGLHALIQAPFGSTNWHGPYIEREIPLDPWGRNYIYIFPGIHNSEGYDLSSRGPDGYAGNEDDIAN